MNQLGITNNRQRTEPSCFISMKLVESAFEYQKEIMELKQEKAMKSKMVEIAKKKELMRKRGREKKEEEIARNANNNMRERERGRERES